MTASLSVYLCSALNLYSTFWQPINHQRLRIEKERENPDVTLVNSLHNISACGPARGSCVWCHYSCSTTRGGGGGCTNILWMKEEREKVNTHVVAHTNCWGDLVFISHVMGRRMKSHAARWITCVCRWLWVWYHGSGLMASLHTYHGSDMWSGSIHDACMCKATSFACRRFIKRISIYVARFYICCIWIEWRCIQSCTLNLFDFISFGARKEKLRRMCWLVLCVLVNRWILLSSRNNIESTTRLLHKCYCK